MLTLFCINIWSLKFEKEELFIKFFLIKKAMLLVVSAKKEST